MASKVFKKLSLEIKLLGDKVFKIKFILFPFIKFVYSLNEFKGGKLDFNRF